MGAISPMMKQYMEIKEKSGDCLLFFRVGDFYEMFFEDAKTASRELELVLTGKDCGLDERAPMCGIPFHAALTYVSRLIAKGYKVAICEQLEDPATAKGLVKRDIIKIYTPGTVTDERMLEQKSNNFIAAIYSFAGMYGFAASDITTGEFFYTSMTIGSTKVHLMDELAKYAPREIIINENAPETDEITEYMRRLSLAYIDRAPMELFSDSHAAELLLSLSEGKLPREADEFSQKAAGALLSYVESTQKTDLKGIVKPSWYRTTEYMSIDSSSRRNLELCETLRDKSRKGSLLWVLDKTETAMGGRALRRWIEQPLIDKAGIDARLDAVSELFDGFMLRADLREQLSGIYDIERMAGRVSLGNVSARDLVSLKNSLYKLPYVKSLLTNAKSEMLKSLGALINPLPELCDLLERSISDNPPISVKDGGVIKDGFDEEIDRLRDASKNGKTWLTELESRERDKTNIRTLKVGYNRVFGYYIEVSKSFMNQVPDYYIRKQTLANNERYITEELKQMEDTILGAEETVLRLEYECFTKIREAALAQAEVIKTAAKAIAEVDALCSLAEVAERENYCRPEITEEAIINIKDGRHPVVEKMPSCDGFVPNDAFLDNKENMLLVITGPNMAGKSTYMRQVAIIALMAQIGSFVPAESATIGISDRIFTRVGASDDLASGQSTFMVEMKEVANIIANATDRSLLILDEIGRGTSTFDGLSIAWAVLEYIVKNIGARTLFATHYHELTELEGKIEAVKNYCVEVRKNGDDIRFIRKIKRGGADGSYGIAVAALAGVPKSVTLRAHEILDMLEAQDIGRKEIRHHAKRQESTDGMDLFSFAANTAKQDDIIKELQSLDVQSMTPIECMNILYNLQLKAKDRK